MLQRVLSPIKMKVRIPKNNVNLRYFLYSVPDQCKKCQIGSKRLNQNKFCQRDYGKRSDLVMNVLIEMID